MRNHWKPGGKSRSVLQPGGQSRHILQHRLSLKEKTGRIKVVCFQKLAEVASQYLHKGTRIVIIGTLDQNRWVSKSCLVNNITLTGQVSNRNCISPAR